MLIQNLKLFDAHFHIIDSRFPLVPNQGYCPDVFTCEDYLSRTDKFALRGGAVVSGSFQAFGQSHLIHALDQLGPSFVGVAQLPISVSDEELLELDRAGIRAIRFNLKRGKAEEVQHLDRMARRVHRVVNWHSEMYVDSKHLANLYQILVDLPAVSIDHLGTSKEGFSTLVKLAEHGVRVKASGFGRVDFDVPAALRDLNSANPSSLMFGTDLPSTRADRPFKEEDITLIIDTLGPEQATKVLCDNAIEFYKIQIGN